MSEEYPYSYEYETRVIELPLESVSSVTVYEASSYVPSILVMI